MPTQDSKTREQLKQIKVNTVFEGVEIEMILHFDPYSYYLDETVLKTDSHACIYLIDSNDE